MGYGAFKNLPRRTASYKVLHDKVFSIANNLKHEGYQCALASMVSKCFDKKSLGGFVTRARVTHV